MTETTDEDEAFHERLGRAFLLMEEGDFIGLFKMTGQNLPLRLMLFIVEEFRDRLRHGKDWVISGHFKALSGFFGEIIERDESALDELELLLFEIDELYHKQDHPRGDGPVADAETRCDREGRASAITARRQGSIVDRDVPRK